MWCLDLGLCAGFSFVVKKGLKIFFCIFNGMPVPLSTIVSST